MKKNILILSGICALTLVSISAHASAFNDDGENNFLSECAPKYSKSRMVTKNQEETEENLRDLLMYQKDNAGRIAYSEKDGFMVTMAPSELTRFNLGMDQLSSQYTRRVLEDDPLAALLYSVTQKKYIPLIRPEYFEIRLPNEDFTFSDCSAIRGQEKRVFYEIKVGQHYKDGRYIYAFKELENGKIKILLGDPKKIDKEKIKLNKEEGAKQITNSIVGEETLDRDEIFREIERSAQNQSKTGNFSYAVTDATPVCLRTYYNNKFADMGCSNYRGFGGFASPGTRPTPGFGQGYCPGCTQNRLKPPGAASPGSR